jgi:hypothetical protein
MDHQSGLVIPPEIRSYLEALLTDAQMTTIDDDTKEEMIKELYIRLDDYLTNTIVEHLPEEHMDAFLKMNEEGRPMSEMQQFLMEKMPDASQVFASAFDEFRSLYLSSVAVSRNTNDTQTK